MFEFASFFNWWKGGFFFLATIRFPFVVDGVEGGAVFYPGEVGLVVLVVVGGGGFEPFFGWASMVDGENVAFFIEINSSGAAFCGFVGNYDVVGAKLVGGLEEEGSF